MKYRAEIDGLRALAVVPVILFHAGFELFSGGFVGVDVFFVISGYLITTILIEDIENQRFSLVNFYERRARRILPALFFVMFVCIPFAWMWMLPSQMTGFSQSLVAVSLFASNVLFWRENGYFDAVAEEKPLLHTWSLAVEEQYYLLFPIFLFLAWRYGKHRVFWMIVVMASISLLLSEWGWRNKATANFYLAPTRAWELFAGSIAAFIVQKRGVQKNNFLALLGLTAIIFSIFAYDESTPFPSVYALVPVLGVVLLVLYAERETLVARLLSTKEFVGLGLISYSAYLWHQPLFAFARIRMFEHPSSLSMLGLSCLSILLAYLSWRYVEEPFRRKGNVTRQKIFNFSTIGIIFFIAFFLLGHFSPNVYKSGQFHPIYAAKSISLGSYDFDNRKLKMESWNLLSQMTKSLSDDVDNEAVERKLWFDINGLEQRYLLVGNSHSKDVFNIFVQSKVFLEHNQVARFGVQIRDLDQNHSIWMTPNYKEANNIIIAHRFSDEDISSLEYVVRRMLSDGKNVTILKNVFEFPGAASTYSLIDQTLVENFVEDAIQMSEIINRRYYERYKYSSENRSFKINERISLALGDLDVKILDRMDYICDDQTRFCYAVQEDLTKNFYDYGHHTLKGANYFASSKLFDEFLSKLVDN
jgi:peptidoglycan/LPS O-acetylase OafA/YrhL